MTPLACLAQSRKLVWEDKIAYLAYKLQEKDLDVALPVVEHRFEPKLYIRTIRVPKDSLFIGRPHKVGHLLKLLEGRVAVLQPDGTHYFSAPSEMRTVPGYMTVALAREDLVCESWHENLTESRDLIWLEEQAFMPVAAVLNRGRIIAESLNRQRTIA